MGKLVPRMVRQRIGAVESAMFIYQFYFDSVHGSVMTMERFRGQPILLVNTASASRHWRQVPKLQKLWENYRHCGLLVLGLPCDDFGHKEPLPDAEIAATYAERFGAAFPLTAKLSLRGRAAHPLFGALREAFGRDALPRWNYFKYLFDARGELVERWSNRTEPDDPVVTQQIERNLRSWII